MQCEARVTRLGTSQQGASNAAMRPMPSLPFGLRRNPASAALSGLAKGSPLASPSALQPSGLRLNAIRRLTANTP